MDNKTKRRSWFSKIETKENALKEIKDVSTAFFFLAALQIGVSFLLGIASAIDGILYAILAFILRRFKSRIAAVLLLLLSLVAIVTTGINMFAGGSGGRNIFLAVIMAYASIRAVQATFKYQKTDELDEITGFIQ